MLLVFYIRLVITRMRYDLYTELKPQVKVSHEFTSIYNTHNVILIMDISYTPMLWSGSITIKNETKRTRHHGNMKRYFFINPTLHKTGFHEIPLFVHYTVHFAFIFLWNDYKFKSDKKVSSVQQYFVAILAPRRFRTQALEQGFPTFFAARTPLSGQSILSTPQKNFEIYIVL